MSDMAKLKVAERIIDELQCDAVAAVPVRAGLLAIRKEIENRDPRIDPRVHMQVVSELQANLREKTRALEVATLASTRNGFMIGLLGLLLGLVGGQGIRMLLS